MKVRHHPQRRGKKKKSVMVARKKGAGGLSLKAIKGENSFYQLVTEVAMGTTKSLGLNVTFPCFTVLFNHSSLLYHSIIFIPFWSHCFECI